MRRRVARIKAKTDLPVIVGFGVNTPEKAEAIASAADGTVVGSAIVSQIGAGKTSERDPGLREISGRRGAIARDPHL